jgi:hypothetical protein
VRQKLFSILKTGGYVPQKPKELKGVATQHTLAGTYKLFGIKFH